MISSRDLHRITLHIRVSCLLRRGGCCVSVFRFCFVAAAAASPRVGPGRAGPDGARSTPRLRRRLPRFYLTPPSSSPNREMLNSSCFRRSTIFLSFCRPYGRRFHTLQGEGAAAASAQRPSCSGIIEC